MNDEFGGAIVEEFVGLKSKMYFMKKIDGKQLNMKKIDGKELKLLKE